MQVEAQGFLSPPPILATIPARDGTLIDTVPDTVPIKPPIQAPNRDQEGKRKRSSARLKDRTNQPHAQHCYLFVTLTVCNPIHLPHRVSNRIQHRPASIYLDTRPCLPLWHYATHGLALWHYATLNKGRGMRIPTRLVAIKTQNVHRRTARIVARPGAG